VFFECSQAVGSGKDMQMGKTGVYYWNKDNFGDQIMRLVMDELLREPAEYRNFDTCDMMGLGSLLERYLSSGEISEADRKRQKKCLQDVPCHIWGSGLLYEADPSVNKLVRPLVFHAVRGELTRSLMEQISGKPVHCVLGDPGILAPLFQPPSAKKYQVGIIAHYREAELPVFEELRQHYENSIVIPVTQPPKDVFAQISSCELIISTSLHGLIVADAYGVKNCWCSASERMDGQSFKFHDYFSAFHTDRQVFDLRSGKFPDPAHDFTLTCNDPQELKLKQTQLINALPFEVRPECFMNETVLPAKIQTAVAQGTVADTVRMIRQAQMPEKPDISVIIPVYNTKEYLGECIDSVLNSTFRNTEIILVDDGSYDGSLEVAVQYAKQYDRITLATECNSTQAYARNLGMTLARGKYIYFADSDDLVNPEGLSIMFEKAEADQLDLLTFNASVISEEDVALKHVDHYNGYYLRQHPYQGIYTGPQLFTLLNQNDEYRCVPYLMFLRKSFLEENSLMYSMKYYHEDELFAFRVFLRAKRVMFIDDNLYQRRLRTGSVMLSEMTERNVLGYFYSHLQMLDLIHSASLTNEEKNAFRNKAYEMLAAGKKRYRQMKKNKDFWTQLPEEDVYVFRTLFANDEESWQKLNRNYRSLEKKYRDIRQSASFRIGRIITWLPRKLRSLLKK